MLRTSCTRCLRMRVSMCTLEEVRDALLSAWRVWTRRCSNQVDAAACLSSGKILQLRWHAHLPLMIWKGVPSLTNLSSAIENDRTAVRVADRLLHAHTSSPTSATAEPMRRDITLESAIWHASNPARSCVARFGRALGMVLRPTAVSQSSSISCTMASSNGRQQPSTSSLS